MPNSLSSDWVYLFPSRSSPATFTSRRKRRRARQVLDQAEKAFVRSAGRSAKRADDAKDLKIAQLQEKLVKKNEVVAELMEEHVQLKKELGER
jgi:hypothetical protein